MVSRGAIADFLKEIQMTSDGASGQKKLIHVASFERIIPPKVLLEKVESHLTGELASDERESIKLLKAAIKRREDGTENNPFALFQE